MPSINQDPSKSAVPIAVELNGRLLFTSKSFLKGLQTTRWRYHG